MHELSIALCIVEAAAEQLARHEGRPLAVHIRVGSLAGVDGEALQSAWLCARSNSAFDLTQLVVEDVRATAWCPVCREEREILSIQQFCCATCGGPAGQVMRGRDLEIVALELTDDIDHAAG